MLTNEMNHNMDDKNYVHIQLHSSLSHPTFLSLSSLSLSSYIPLSLILLHSSLSHSPHPCSQVDLTFEASQKQQASSHG
jgi:uncharacterized NAD-dependent epimerase/dehydratase family protein